MIYKLYKKRPGKKWKPVWSHHDINEVRNKAITQSFVNIANKYGVININSVSRKIHIIEFWVKGRLVENKAKPVAAHQDGILVAESPDTLVFTPGRKEKCSNSCESSDINVRLWLWALCWPIRALWRSLRACLEKK